MWEICDLTGVISLLNIPLSKLYISSSASAVLIACLHLVCPSESALQERGEKQVFISVGPLCEHGRII